MWQLRLMITIIIVVILVSCPHSSNGLHRKYMPIYRNETWLNPPNRRVYQKVMLERMQYIMDLQADPCEDFYQFACGNYIKMVPEVMKPLTKCPLFEVKYLSVFTVDNYVENDLRPPTTETERMLRDFKLSCINSKDNLQSSVDFVKSFGSWPALDSRWSERTFNLWETVVSIGNLGFEGIFTFGIDTGTRDRIDIGVTSLTIGKTEIFDDEAQVFIMKIQKSVEKVVSTNYIHDMIPRLQTFFNQMRQISQNSQIKTEGNEFYLNELQRRAPGCDFAKIFSLITGRRYEATETITVTDIDYVENACQLIQRTDKRTLADYLLTLLLVYDESSREVSNLDTKALKEHCEKEIKQLLKPVLTGMFAREYVGDDIRQDVMNLTKNLQRVGIEMLLSNTSWLDEHTRRTAAKKMEAVTPRIGYFDNMASENEIQKLYSKVKIDATNYLQNRKQLVPLVNALVMNSIGKDYSTVYFDPLEMAPRFVPTGRGILHVQAAALMPPVYHKFAPSFVKHSTLLSVLGHELMHNFDVTGIDIDEHGKKNQWMTANRYLSYNYRSECIYSQFAKYKLDNSDIYVNSSATMGENVADFDGLKLAFELFKQWMAENPDKVWEEEFTFAPLQMTHEQAFFLSFAQFWCDSRSFDELVEQIGTDEHAPGKFRVIGSLSNLPHFAKAFNCPTNSKMNPAEKCTYFFD